MAGMDHLLDRTLGNELAHAVVDASPGQDYLGDVADLLRLVGQIVGIDPNAVSTDQAGFEFEKVPLRTGRFQNFVGIDTHPVKDQRQFVHQGYIQVTLGILDDLGRLSHLDRGCPVNAGCHYRFIDRCNNLQGDGILTRHDFLYSGKGMLLVTRIYAFRAVANRKVRPATQTGNTLQNRHAFFLGHTGIDS